MTDDDFLRRIGGAYIQAEQDNERRWRAMTDDPVARLKAGLDADEAAAKATQEVAPSDRELAQQAGPCVSGPGYVHIARHGPARALREVAAKREILDRHSPIKPYGDMIACAWCSDDVDAGARWHERWPCPDVLALAAVYGDDDT